MVRIRWQTSTPSRSGSSRSSSTRSGGVSRDLLERGRAVLGPVHLEALVAQHPDEHRSDLGIVFHHEKRLSTGGTLGRSSRGRFRRRRSAAWDRYAPAPVKHTLSVLVENQPGVLSRVSGLFTRRGFNIDSLAVSPTETAERSRMTIAVDSSRFPVEQITKQLDKLVNVIKIRDLDPERMVARELRSSRSGASPRRRSEVIQLVEIFEGKIVDVHAESLTIQLTGESGVLEQFEELMRPFGLIELVKTGVVALGRGSRPT